MSTESSHLKSLAGTSLLDVYPLTGAQNNVWYHQQLDPESSVYHIGAAITFAGRLEIQRLEAAWKKVIEHVDTLGSSIILQDGIPFQKIHSEASTEIAFSDVRSDADPTLKAKKLLKDALIKPLNYFEAPCFRLGIIQTSDSNWIHYFIPHHLFLDGSARANILRLVAKAYSHIDEVL